WSSAHVPQLEDIWIHFRDEYIICQRDYERLTLDEVRQFGLADVPMEAQDNDE
ncbi:hypothetical protein KI387_018480, partial [Taxus chinensis]